MLLRLNGHASIIPFLTYSIFPLNEILAFKVFCLWFILLESKYFASGGYFLILSIFAFDFHLMILGILSLIPIFDFEYLSLVKCFRLPQVNGFCFAFSNSSSTLPLFSSSTLLLIFSSALDHLLLIFSSTSYQYAFDVISTLTKSSSGLNFLIQM